MAQSSTMHTPTRLRVQTFAKEMGFDDLSLADQFERYIAWVYLAKYVGDDPREIERVINGGDSGGGADEGLDIVGIVINGRIMDDLSDIVEIIKSQKDNVVKLTLIQAKTSASVSSKMLSKFLHGVNVVTEVALGQDYTLSPRLKTLASIIRYLAENADRIDSGRISLELYYVTTAPESSLGNFDDNQVQRELNNIKNADVYDVKKIYTQGWEDILIRRNEHSGPQNVSFKFVNRVDLPVAEGVEQAYIGTLSVREILKLLRDQNGDLHDGVFDDNVRRYLGDSNIVNQRIAGTLNSPTPEQFTILNNGITIIAPALTTVSHNFTISGYQIVNGGQTSVQLEKWARSIEDTPKEDLLDEVYVPVKLVISQVADIRTSVAIATNLQSAITDSDIQSTHPLAKDAEFFFSQTSGDLELRYERQKGSQVSDVAKLRVFSTEMLNRAVASVVFGESQRATRGPKELTSSDSFVWGDYPVELYYYSAWIAYRVDMCFRRNSDNKPIVAGRYYIEMLVSAALSPKRAEVFMCGDLAKVVKYVESSKGSDYRVDDRVAGCIDGEIVSAMTFVQGYFRERLENEGSLTKDKVRNVSPQNMLTAYLEWRRSEVGETI